MIPSERSIVSLREERKMKRYLIEDAKCGISDGGIACGPVPGHVVTSVKFSDGEESRWLNLAEVDGMPNVYLTEEEVYEAMIKDDPEDETLTERLEEDYIEGLDGIAFGMDYSETFASIEEEPDSPAVPLIKYMIALTRCEMGDVQSLLKLGIGRYADELEIPVSDVEEEYLEETEEDEDEDE